MVLYNNDILDFHISPYLEETEKQMLRKTSFYFTTVFDSKELTFNDLVKEGNLEMMKLWYSRLSEDEHKKEKYPWDFTTFDCAALDGNLDSMKWLNEIGCPFHFHSLHIGTFENALKHGNLKNIKWLKEKGCRWNSFY